uniref:Ig-like domain-containing protein n=1 Tax=Timema tahoe TaxID=61484 RepID=A0A7R9IEL6_9NEOP|nr:unnamed protein product [Timema tahoe]
MIRKRMTAHECLLHSWLMGDHKDRTQPISASRYTNIRNKIRAKYSDWNSFVLPIGRLAEYSSLRKLMVEKYRIYDSYFGKYRRQAAPRFVIKPSSAFAYEGQSAKFYCRVIAIATPTLTWFHNNVELRQSVKFMKRYAGDDYTFIINRVKLEDRGEYIIRAENHYGFREEVVFLNVQPVPKTIPQYKPEVQPLRRREPLSYNMWQEEKESAPCFTFLLRPRVMQYRQTCKLLCCLSGKPAPTVKWFKNQRELTKYEYNMTHADGVVTMEIVDCKPEDSGKYRCVATNIHGSDETSAVVIVEDRRYIEQPSRPASSPAVTVNKTSYNSNNDSSSKYSSSTQAQSSSSHGNYKSAATIAVSSSNVTENSSEKRNIKKYGSKLDTTGSPSRSRSATKELILPPDDSLMCAPNFSTKLQDITINDGDQLLLSCTVEGDPEPQVTWSKNGQKDGEALLAPLCTLALILFHSKSVIRHEVVEHPQIISVVYILRLIAPKDISEQGHPLPHRCWVNLCAFTDDLVS